MAGRGSRKRRGCFGAAHTWQGTPRCARRGAAGRCRQRGMKVLGAGTGGSVGRAESRKLSEASRDLAEWRALTSSSSSLLLPLLLPCLSILFCPSSSSPSQDSSPSLPSWPSLPSSSPSRPASSRPFPPFLRLPYLYLFQPSAASHHQPLLVFLSPCHSHPFILPFTPSPTGLTPHPLPISSPALIFLPLINPFLSLPSRALAIG